MSTEPRAKISSTTVDVPQGTVSVQFTNGNTIVVSLDALPAEMQRHAAMFGLRRKIVNSFAGAEGDVELAEKSARAEADKLAQGQWTAEREGGGEKSSTDLAVAIAQLTGKDLPAVNEKLDAMTKEQKLALRKDPRIAAKLAAMKAERLAAKAGEAQEGGIAGMF
jgi:hypothetical protein